MSRLKIYAIPVLLFLLGQVSLLLAEVTPAPGEGYEESSSYGTYTDLVETTYDDPNWVLVTSESILRENICIASDPDHPYSWYEKVFEPCYNYNRYWKLAPSAETGRAFPMSAFGDVGITNIDNSVIIKIFYIFHCYLLELWII